MFRLLPDEAWQVFWLQENKVDHNKKNEQKRQENRVTTCKQL